MTRRPSNGTVGDGFGWRFHPIAHEWRHHDGEDIAHDKGFELVSPAHGLQLVAYTYSGGWGQLATLRGGRLTIRLAHTARLAPGVRVGDYFAEGELVAIMGDTGLATGVHLHWEVLVDGELVDPEQWLYNTRPPAPKPTPTPTPTPEEEEDMTPRQIHMADAKGKVIRALIVPGTGYFVKWTEGSTSSPAPTYANAIARNMETGSSTAVTPSLFAVFEREAIALRPKDSLAIELADVAADPT